MNLNLTQEDLELFRHRFIAIEGVDGSGKTTTTQAMCEFLNSKGIPSITTKEPGNTPLGDKIRELLLHEDHIESRWTKTFLFMASRAELIKQVIYPALKEGKTVITDRYVTSTAIYQWAAKTNPFSVGMHKVIKMHDYSLHLWPDITVIIDIDRKTSESRRSARGTGTDNMEQELDTKFDAIRNSYIAYAEAYPLFTSMVDGRVPQDEVLDSVLHACKNKLIDIKISGWRMPQVSNEE